MSYNFIHDFFFFFILNILSLGSYEQKRAKKIYMYKHARISQLPLNFKITIKFHSPMASVFNGSKMAHRICASRGSVDGKNFRFLTFDSGEKKRDI